MNKIEEKYKEIIEEALIGDGTYAENVEIEEIEVAEVKRDDRSYLDIYFRGVYVFLRQASIIGDIFGDDNPIITVSRGKINIFLQKRKEPEL